VRELKSTRGAEEKISVQRVGCEAWYSIVKNFRDYNFEQSFEYTTSVAAKDHAAALFLTARAGERLLAATSLRLKIVPMLGRGLAYISGGPMMQAWGEDWSAAQSRTVLAALKNRLVEQDGHFLYIRLPIAPPPPRDEASAAFASLGFCETLRARSYRSIVCDLKASDQTLRAALHSKWRSRLNSAEKAGLTVERGTSTSFFSRFLKLFSQMRETKDFSIKVHPEFFFQLPPESIGLEVLIASKDGRDAAGHVHSLLGDTAVHLFGATNELGRSTKAGYLLNWQAMLLAKERGLGWYDLGGVDPEANPGVYEFKTRTGGQELAAVGPYEARPSGPISIILDKLFALRARRGN
jgi:lipid II:glycine glycyltransferase (peptidoglycan interpeptide bridge formation enzyme)